MPVLTTVTSLNFDYDGVYSPRSNGDAVIFVELDRHLEPGEELRLAVGLRTFRFFAFEEDGTDDNFLGLGRHDISAGGTRFKIVLPSQVLDAASELDFSEIGVLVRTADEIGPTTSVGYTRADEAADHMNVGNRLDDTAMFDQYGRPTSLLNENSTQLLLLDMSAAWCAPSQYMAQNDRALRDALGGGIEYKTLLLQDYDGNPTDVADAARWARSYKIGGDVLTLGADEEAYHQFLEHNFVPGFPNFVLVDQVTGEVLANFSLSDVPNDVSIAEGVQIKAAQILTAVEALAGTPGVTRGGTAWGDAIAGSVRDDLLSGAGGDDLIQGGYGHDKEYGGTGHDELNGDAGNDRLYGDEGRDLLRGGEGDDKLFGGADDDRLIGNGGFNRLDGGDGADTAAFGDAGDLRIRLAGDVRTTIYIGGVATGTVRSVENIDGGSGADRLTGSAGVNVLNGGDGNDRLDGGSSPGTGNIGETDLLNGEGGDDDLWVMSGYAILTGGTGVNHIHLATGSTVLRSGGYDIVDFSLASRAVTMSRESLPYFYFGAGKSSADGGNLFGVAEVIGTRFRDQLVANDDLHVLDGGLGRDVLTGGLGEDAFRFSTALNKLTNVDTIVDFSHVADTIRLEKAIFTKAGPVGTLSAGALANWDAPNQADDRILYRHVDSGDADAEKDTILLYYDPTGGSTSDAVRFAKLTHQDRMTLDASDFLIV